MLISLQLAYKSISDALTSQICWKVSDGSGETEIKAVNRKTLLVHTNHTHYNKVKGTVRENLFCC
jgi:hypothetical protein